MKYIAAYSGDSNYHYCLLVKTTDPDSHKTTVINDRDIYQVDEEDCEVIYDCDKNSFQTLGGLLSLAIEDFLDSKYAAQHSLLCQVFGGQI